MLTIRIARSARALTAAIAVAVGASTAHAATILESATMGPTGNLGGYSLSSQFLGNRFTLTDTYHITAIGGHISTFNGSVWGAIVTLPSAGGLPTATASTIETQALVSGLLEDTGNSGDLRVGVDVLLGPGHYALVFGDAGRFGSTGSGAMPTGGQADLPGASYFFWNGSSWTSGGFSQARFVVEGDLQAVPEPATSMLFGAGLAGLAARARRRSTRRG
jgi:hypothetical protein